MKEYLLNDLIASKALIDTPEKWIQDDLSQTAEGVKCGVNQKEAVCFCSMGAFVHYLDGKPHSFERDIAVIYALDAASERVSGDPSMNIVRFNDTHSHSEVMAVWNNAIDAERNAI